MTVVATDNFNRANGAVGANWTAVTGETIPNISSNALNLPSIGIDYGGKYTAASTGAGDHYAQLVAILTVASALQEGGPFVRAPSGATADFYLGHSPAYSTGAYKIIRVTGGVFTELAVTGTNPLGTGTRTVKIEAVGTTLTLYEGGVSKLSTTDANFGSANQYTGLHIYTDAGATNMTFDDFEMGTVTAAAGKAPPFRSRATQRVLMRR